MSGFSFVDFTQTLNEIEQRGFSFESKASKYEISAQEKSLVDAINKFAKSQY